MKKFEVTTYKFSYTIEAETFEAARAEMRTFAEGYKGMFNVQPPYYLELTTTEDDNVVAYHYTVKDPNGYTVSNRCVLLWKQR